VFLVISQYASMQLMQPKSDDQAQQQSNAVLKLLPLMIGWFSLNVPAALCVYWVVNNIFTTATSLLIRNSMKTEPAKSVGSGSAAATSTIFAPPRERPTGFGDATPRKVATSNDVKPITAIDDIKSITTSTITDAEIVEDDDDDDASDKSATSTSSKKRGGKKKRKN
jgi:YidC/Oxa1 family membrane protein insertase